MVQATLDAFVVSVRPYSQAPRSQTQPSAIVETRSTECQAAEPAMRNHLFRTLACLGSGLYSSKRAKAELHHLAWDGLQQVAGYDTGGSLALDDAATISSIRLCPVSHRVAFAQASGVLNIYPLDGLIRDAEQLQRRAQASAHARMGTAAGGSMQQPSQTEAAGQPEEPAQGDVTGQAEEPAEAARDAPNRRWRTVGTRTRSHHSQQQAWAQQQAHDLQHRVAAAWGAARDALPAGGWRVSVGQRLSDVAWSPSQEGLLALAGGSAQQISLMDLGQGRQRLSALTARPGRGGGGAHLSSLAFMPQGPYTMCACAHHGAAVQLWDVRRARVATAEVLAPGNRLLASGPQVSRDGHLLYAATSNCQLLVWDLRKGSSSSGVMQFGGTGLYHHPLLAQHDLSGPLQRAWRQQQQAAAAGLGAALGEPQQRWQPVVDSLMLDPTNHSRVAVIMQDCSSAVVQLPGCTVSHMWPSVRPDTASRPAVGGHGRYVMQRKKGCWAAGGNHLLLPQLVHLPDPSAMIAEQESDEAALSCHPALGIMDCRPGAFQDDALVTCTDETSWQQQDQDQQDQDQDQPSRSSACTGPGNWPKHWLRGGRRALSAHQTPQPVAGDIPGAPGHMAWGPTTAAGIGQGGGPPGWQQGGSMGQRGHVRPVSGWVTCIEDASGLAGRPWVLAGTQAGHLVLLGAD